MPPPTPVNPSRLKTSLKMAISKLQFIQEKKSALTKQQRRQLADLLNQGKESSAKIRVENIIRDDIYIELLEFLELYCELVLARISLITDQSTCDESLLEAVHSIIYSAPHTELKELTQIRELLILKFGPEFGKKAIDNEENLVPEKIIKRCKVPPPSSELINLYLCEIAKAYEAPYSGLAELLDDEADILDSKTGEDDDDDDDEPGSGEAIKNSTEPIAETADGPPVKKSEKKSEADELDALKARFAALKR